MNQPFYNSYDRFQTSQPNYYLAKQNKKLWSKRIPATTAIQLIYPFDSSKNRFDPNLFQPSSSDYKIFDQDIEMINRALKSYFKIIKKKKWQKLDPVVMLLMICWIIFIAILAKWFQDKLYSKQIQLGALLLILSLVVLRKITFYLKLKKETKRAQNLVRSWNLNIFNPIEVTLILGPSARYLMFVLDYKLKKEDPKNDQSRFNTPKNLYVTVSFHKKI